MVEQLLDLVPYAEQLSVLQEDPNTRIVGSIGRMVAGKQVIRDPYIEFDDRERAGLRHDEASDLDVLGTSSYAVAIASAAGSIPIDTRAFSDTDVLIRHEAGRWQLVSKDVEFEATIHPKLMEPIVDTIQGITIVTVPLQTHSLLHGLRARNSQKDRYTEATLGYLMHQANLIEGYIPSVSKDDLRPFTELAWLLRCNLAGIDTHHSSDDNRHSS